MRYVLKIGLSALILESLDTCSASNGSDAASLGFLPLFAPVGFLGFFPVVIGFVALGFLVGGRPRGFLASFVDLRVNCRAFGFAASYPSSSSPSASSSSASASASEVPASSSSVRGFSSVLGSLSSASELA